MKSKEIIDYPNKLDDLCVLNFKSNQIVSSPQSKSNHNVDGDRARSSKSPQPNRLGHKYNQLDRYF